ncbi:transposable element Tcb1 transposase [Trichonephila clavipes]|nr:transposable element Tcb1 transposase [Trichonephila clavipes]
MKSCFPIGQATSHPEAPIGRRKLMLKSVVKKFNETGSKENKVRSGRPGIFSAREKRSIIKEVKKNPKISAPQLAKDVTNTSHKTFSVQTIRNVLHEESYYGRAARKKPFISGRKRLDFAKSCVNLSDEFGNTVIFSNETKFNIFGSDGRQYVWRKPNTELEKQHLTPTMKHGGGSVLVLGCMTANGFGKPCFIDGIMTARTYIDILRHNLQSSARKLGLGTSFVFQLDNDPKHTANLTREWLLNNSPRQLKTPPQLPDINPIENLWHKLDVEVRKHKISCKDELKRILLQEWHKIPNSTTKTLVFSMRNRLQAVINAKDKIKIQERRQQHIGKPTFCSDNHCQIETLDRSITVLGSEVCQDLFHEKSNLQDSGWMAHVSIAVRTNLEP